MSKFIKYDLKAAELRDAILWVDQVVEEWLGGPGVPVAWPCTIMHIVNVEDRKRIGDLQIWREWGRIATKTRFLIQERSNFPDRYLGSAEENKGVLWDHNLQEVSELSVRV